MKFITYKDKESRQHTAIQIKETVCQKQHKIKYAKDKYRKKNPIPVSRKLCPYCNKRPLFNRKDAKTCGKTTCYKIYKRDYHEKRNKILKKIIGNIRCLNCKKEFKPFTLKQKFCSYNCKLNSYKIKRNKNKKIKPKKICLMCKAKFLRTSSQKFCSIKCRYNYSQRYKEKRVFICKICKKRFFSKNYNQRFCSLKCNIIFRKRIVKRNLIYKIGKKNCFNCKKEFEITKNNSMKKFCSRKCGLEFWKIKRRRNFKKINCFVCGVIFKPRYLRQKLCGNKKCRRALNFKIRGSGIIYFSKLRKDNLTDLLKKQSYLCNLCNKNLKELSQSQIHIDHHIPFARKEEFNLNAETINKINNLQVLCFSCNAKKRDKITFDNILKAYSNCGWKIMDKETAIRVMEKQGFNEKGELNYPNKRKPSLFDMFLKGGFPADFCALQQSFFINLKEAGLLRKDYQKLFEIEDKQVKAESGIKQ